MTDLSLTTSRTIAAPRARVFDAWLDAKMLARFMKPMPEMPEPKSETDPPRRRPVFDPDDGRRGRVASRRHL